MALKLNMSKTYDRIEWQYMEKLMKKMSFGETWTNLMMQCISKATYSVMINGEPHGHIQSTRRLCQGDQLSPFLFLLCIEGFHKLLKKEEENGDIRGLSICRNGPKLTYLLFSDDRLVFCRAKTSECEKLLEILTTYERASRQQINRGKTILFFSKSTSQQMQTSIKDVRGNNGPTI